MLEGKLALGAEAGLGSPLSAELLSRMAFDFVMVDTQHGRWDDESTMYAFKSISLGSAMPMARARRNDFGLIGRLLDMGAMGVVAPMVNNVEEAEMVVQAAHFPPLGGRSFGPFGTEHLGPDYDSWIDDELFVAVQIETADGHKNAEAILAVDGIDGCWIGPNDLSRSMGIELRSPAHDAAIVEIIEACKKVGKIPGFSAPNASIAQKWIDAGCLFVTVGEDGGWVADGAQQALAALGRS
jgi:4-hydroxy-2-oxoheptanedioate aldolase